MNIIKASLETLSILSTVQLRKITSDTGDFLDFGSGCIFKYKNKNYLFTVSHILKDGKEWKLELERIPGKNESASYYLENFQVPKEFDFNSKKLEDVDFAYLQIPNKYVPKFQVLTQSTIQYSTDCMIHDLNFKQKIDKASKFCFYGQSEFNIKNGILNYKSKYIKDLKYICFENNLFKFKLPFGHPGHFFFKGLSGTPILDMNSGKIISLLVKGPETINEDVVYGLPLEKYIRMLAIEAEDN